MEGEGKSDKNSERDENGHRKEEVKSVREKCIKSEKEMRSMRERDRVKGEKMDTDTL